MKHAAIIVLLASCGNPAVGTHTAALSASGDCMTAPVDGSDATTTIQGAIDAVASRPDGGTVCLGAGHWRITRQPPGTYDRFAALHIGARIAYDGHPELIGHNVTLRGVGPETVLDLVGDQGGTASIALDILPGAEHVRIADLTLDLSGTTNTHEQTHAIATSGTCAPGFCRQITDLSIDHVAFNHPRNTTTRKGDCLRLLGNDDNTRVTGVRVVGSDFRSCARSAIEFQRGVYDAVVSGNTISAVKTCIDGEATGESLGTDARLTVTGNVFRPGCKPAISLTNYTGATISANSMAGAVTSYRSTQVVIAANSIQDDAVDDTGTIDVSNVCEGLVISGNSLTRTGSAGPLIKLWPHSGSACGGAAVTGNALNQRTLFHAIAMESASQVAIAGNKIGFPDGATGMAGIYERATMTDFPVKALSITGNAVTGNVAYAVELQAHPAAFGAGVNVSGNSADGPTYGMYCADSNFTAPIASHGNAWMPGVWPHATITSGVP